MTTQDGTNFCGILHQLTSLTGKVYNMDNDIGKGGQYKDIGIQTMISKSRQTLDDLNSLSNQTKVCGVSQKKYTVTIIVVQQTYSP